MAHIYLSSTSEDLSERRAAVYAALRELRHDVRQMEHFTAASATPAEVSVKGAAEADLCVVIVAWRYGSVPKIYGGKPSNESFTVLEYRAARERKVPFKPYNNHQPHAPRVGGDPSCSSPGYGMGSPRRPSKRRKASGHPAALSGHSILADVYQRPRRRFDWSHPREFSPLLVIMGTSGG